MVQQAPLPHKIHMLAHMIELRASSILHSHGQLAFNSFVILHKLSTLGELNQQFIAQKMQVSTAAISKQVKNLVEKGLVTSTINEQNRREHRISITNKGQQVHKELTTLLMDNFNEQIKNFKEREELEALLNKLLVIMCDGNDRQTC